MFDSDTSNNILQEYSDQLNQIQDLLRDDPTNAEFLQLKKDLMELISLTTHQEQLKSVSSGLLVLGASSGAPHTGSKEQEEKEPVRKGIEAIYSPSENADHEEKKKSEAATFPLSKKSTSAKTNMVEPTEMATAAISKRKVPANISETFQVPSHLIPLESDTAAEQNRKRRTIKALKRQHKEKVKELHATSKQQSWQQFSSKAMKKIKGKADSIWRTSETRGVGVVGTDVQKQEAAHSSKRFKSGG
jgi:survival-of-motor-neuron-related-splicing factor 30